MYHLIYILFIYCETMLHILNSYLMYHFMSYLKHLLYTYTLIWELSVVRTAL